jgi:putative transposase
MVLMRGIAPTNHCTAPEGCVPFTPMPSDPTLEVAVLPVRGWVRRKSLDATNRYK